MNKPSLIMLLSYLLYSLNTLGAEAVWEAREVKFQPINTRVPSSAKVNLNTADKAQLLTLKGIGIKKAEAILAHRAKLGAFSKLTDLTQVKGLSKKLVSKIIEKNQDLLEL